MIAVIAEPGRGFRIGLALNSAHAAVGLVGLLPELLHCEFSPGPVQCTSTLVRLGLDFSTVLTSQDWLVLWLLHCELWTVPWASACYSCRTPPLWMTTNCRSGRPFAVFVNAVLESC